MKIESKPKETDTRSILIAAAGTGGHIMPAMAVADKLINKKFFYFISLNLLFFSIDIGNIIFSIQNIQCFKQFFNFHILID